MASPRDPELGNAVSNIIGLLTGLELGEDAAVSAILGHPLPVSNAPVYIAAMVVLCQHLIRELASVTDVEPIEVLRQVGRAIGS
jgi:hypothetical protein